MKMSLGAVLFLASVSLIVFSPCAWAHIDVTPAQARDLIDSMDDLVVVDVRELYEYCDAVGHIPGALNYPLSSGVLQARYEELPLNDPILVVCRSGGRSNQAANFLDSQGFSIVYDMMGGMNAWIWETAPCKYAGGSGTADDPYQIATAADLIALGETPEDYDKHFILTADLDLDPNLPGRKVFDWAVIAPDTNDESPFQGTPFSGTFDGNGHVINGLRLIADAKCDNYLGLFGRLDGTVRDLGLANAVIQGRPGGHFLGVMAGVCDGTIERCYAAGSILGKSAVGGLVGMTGGEVVDCYSQVEVGVFAGGSEAGGLVAVNGGVIRTSYATGTVGGVAAGRSPSGLTSVSYGPVVLSFWDTESSDISVSYGGFGRTTAEMKTPSTFVGFSGDVWELTEGDYPRLAWEETGGTPLANEMERSYAGMGTEEAPFLLVDANDLYVLACRPDDWHGHIELTQDINMVSIGRYPTIADFNGVLNGNGHAVRNLQIHENTSMLGLVGFMRPDATIQDLKLENVSIVGFSRLGGLVGVAEGGQITNCACEGTLSGVFKLGGLAGQLEFVHVVGCSADVRISAGDPPEIIGGLVGYARGSSQDGGHIIRDCYARGTLTLGNQALFCGGLVGSISGISMSHCFAASELTLGENGRYIGGLIGSQSTSSVESSFWDMDVSGFTESDGGVGLTTAQMQTATTFLEAGWDFVDEAENGEEDLWYLLEGDYPRLWWEKYGGGTGEPNDPYLIYTAEHLNGLGAEPNDYDKHFKLMADIDLAGYAYDRAVIAPDVGGDGYTFPGTPFTGVFDGNGHAVLNLTIAGKSYLGLFGQLGSGGEVKDLGVVDVDITGSYYAIGGLVGDNFRGNVTTSYSTGTVTGYTHVGGLVGYNQYGDIATSFSTVAVSATFSGNQKIGGLVGVNAGRTTTSYSTGTVSGQRSVGGLVGQTTGSIDMCYSTGMVSGDQYVGGLVGDRHPDSGAVTGCFWDVQTSGLGSSEGGIGRTTAEMQSVATFLDAGWDFIDEIETENGTDDIWWILEGQDYPQLWWELFEEELGQ